MKRQKMRTEQKSNVKNSVGRLVFVGLSLLLQVLWILLLFLRLLSIHFLDCVRHGLRQSFHLRENRCLRHLLIFRSQYHPIPLPG